MGHITQMCINCSVPHICSIALWESFRVENDNNIAYIMLLILYCLIEYWFFNCILTQMKFHRLWSFCLPSGVIFYLVNCLSQLISIAIEESGRVFFEKIKYIFVLRVIDKVLLNNICHIKYLNIIFTKIQLLQLW